MTAMRYGRDGKYSSSKNPQPETNILGVLEKVPVDLLEVVSRRNTVEYGRWHIPCSRENCFLGIESAGIR